MNKPISVQQGEPIRVQKSGDDSTVITAYPDAEFIFEFPIDDAQIRVDGNDIIVECEDGHCIYLLEAFGQGKSTLTLSNGHKLTLDELLQSLDDDQSALRDLNSPKLAAHEDRLSDGFSSDGNLLSSGLSEYRGSAGEIIGSIDKLSHLYTTFWEDTPQQYDPPQLGAPSNAFTPTPTVNLGYTIGASYLNDRTVMEGDSYGIRIAVEFSEPAAPATTITLRIGGTANMAAEGAPTPADEYVHWKEWTVTFSDGTVMRGANCISESGGNLVFTLPGGGTGFTVTAPLLDNNLSDGSRTFTYTVVAHGEYALTSPQTDTIVIVDENQAQDIVPGWRPPIPGGPFPPGYVGPTEGPIATVDIDGTTDRSVSIAENSNAPVTYIFSLKEIATGAARAPEEDITVTMRITGQNGLKLDGAEKDMNFDLSSFTATPGVSNVACTENEGHIELTFTLTPAYDGRDIAFTGTPIADTRPEFANGKQESVSIDIVKAEGNETVRGPGVSTTVLDTPIVSIEVDRPEIVESANVPEWSNEATFTLQLTAPPPSGDLDVNLAWNSVAGNTTELERADVDIYIHDGASWTLLPATSLFPSLLTFTGANQTIKIRVVAKDDTLSENLETLRIAIDPPSGGSTSSGYYIVDAAKKQADLTLHDDTSPLPWAGSDADSGYGTYLDGPIVRFVRLDSHGNPLTTDGTVTDHHILAEKGSSTISFAIALMDERSNLLNAEEEVTVIFTLTPDPSGEMNIAYSGDPTPQDSNDSSWDIWLNLPKDAGDTVTNADGIAITKRADGRYEATVPAEKSAIVIEAKTHEDLEAEQLATENFVVSVDKVHGNEARAGEDAKVSIADTLVVEFTPSSDFYISESAPASHNAMECHLTISDTRSEAYDLYFKVEGYGPNQATLGKDFAVPVGMNGSVVANHGNGLFSIRINSGTTTADFSLKVIDDALTEGNEQFVVKVVQPPNALPDAEPIYITGAQGERVATIVDDNTAWPGPGVPQAGNPPQDGEGNVYHDNGIIAGGDARADEYASLEGPKIKLETTVVANGSAADSSNASVMEHNGSVTYTVSATHPNTGAAYNTLQNVVITIDISSLSGSTFNPQTDFASIAGVGGASVEWPVSGDYSKIQVTIPQDSKNASFTITPQPDQHKGDANDATNEKFQLQISKVHGNEAQVHDNDTVTTTIVDPPSVSVTVADSQIFESAEPGNGLGAGGADIDNATTFTVALDTPSLVPTIVQLAWSGSASTADYLWSTDGGATWNPANTPLPSSVTIPAGASSGSVMVKAVDDRLSENAETITVSVLPADRSSEQDNAGYHVAAAPSADSATTSIVDDTRLGQSHPDSNTFLDGPYAMLVCLDAGGAIIYKDGVPATAAQVREMIDGVDADGDPNANFTAVNYKVVLVKPSYPGTGSLNAHLHAAEEDVTVTIDVASVDGAHFSGAGLDYGFASIPGKVAWTPNAGAPSKGSLVVTIDYGSTGTAFTGGPVADAREEQNENVTLTISKVDGNEGRFDPNRTVSTEILDAPTAWVSADYKYYSESGASGAANTMSFTVHLSSPALENTPIYLDWSDDSALKGVDYAGTGAGGALPAYIVIPKGSTSGQVQVKIIDDNLTESNETVTLSLQNPPSGASGGNLYHLASGDNTRPGSATSTIVDDSKPWPSDADPVANPAPPHHGTTPTTQSVEDYAPLEGPYVKIFISGHNYGKIAANGTSAEVMEYEDGSVTYTLQVVNGANSSTTVNAAEDITVTLKLADLGVGMNFDETNQDVTFTSGSGTITWPVNVNGTDDYTLIRITIPKDSNSVTFTANPTPDLLDESSWNAVDQYVHEKFSVTIDSVSGNEAKIADADSVSTTIVDSPRVSVALDHAAIFESPGYTPDGETEAMPTSATFTFSLDAPVLVDTVVNVDWSGGTYPATPNADFTIHVNGAAQSVLPNTITIKAGETSATVTVTAFDDALTEEIETIIATIMPESGTDDLPNHTYHIAPGNASKTLDIRDDAYAGKSPANPFLDGPIVMLVYCDASGNILLGADNKPITSKTFLENLEDDAVYYKVALFEANADGGLKVDGSGKYVECTAAQKITATISAEGFDADTVLNTVAADKDFQFQNNVSGQFTWQPNGTTGNDHKGTITVVVQKNTNGTVFKGSTKADSKAEAKVDGDDNIVQEGFDLSITEVEGNEARILAGNELTTIIADIPEVGIAADKTHYSESAGEMSFTLTLSSPVPYPITIPVVWNGQNDSVNYAIDGTDFGTADSNITHITIPANSKEYVFSVPIIQDALTENVETVSITLQPDPNCNSATPEKAVYHIKTGGDTATTQIIDNTLPWNEGDYGELPPEVPHGTVNGPQVSIRAEQGNENNPSTEIDNRYDTFHGSNDPKAYMYDGDDRNAVVLEGVNTPGFINYVVELLDENGNPYDGQEGRPATTQDVEVTVTLTGKGGIEYSEDGSVKGDFFFDIEKMLNQYPNSGASITYTNQHEGDPGYPAELVGKLTFTIPAGEWKVDFSSCIIPDNLTETGRNIYDENGDKIGVIPDEAFDLTITDVKGNEGEAHPNKGAITTTIDEDFQGQQISLFASSPNVVEGQPAKFYVTTSRLAEEEITVVLQPVEIDGDDAASGREDFEGARFTITIPAGTTAGQRIEFNIDTFNDILGEGKENFKLQIVDVIGSEATINPARTYATGTIVDDMNGPIVGFEKISCSDTVQESDNNVEAVYRVAFNAPSGTDNGVPVEDVYLTFKVSGATTAAAPDAASPAADLDWLRDDASLAEIAARMDLPTGVEFVGIDTSTGTFIIKVPAGFGNTEDWNGQNWFEFKLFAKDDHLTENREAYQVTIVGVGGNPDTTANPKGKGGSEAAIDSSNSSVVTEIIDDSEIANPKDANGDYVRTEEERNAILDGPYVVFDVPAEGKPLFVSESQGIIEYGLKLIDPDGQPYTALEDIKVKVVYTTAPGDGYDGAAPRGDFEVITEYVTIKAGSQGSNLADDSYLKLRLADDSFSEKNERFTISITEATGNEARVSSTDSSLPNSIQTVIVDDTQPWLPEYGQKPDSHGALDGPVLYITGSGTFREDCGSNTFMVQLSKAPEEKIDVTMKLDLTQHTGTESPPHETLTLDDLFGSDFTPESIATDLGDLNPGASISNVRYIDGDPAKGILFDFVVPKDYTSMTLKVPVENDKISEDRGQYTLAIHELDGAEAKTANSPGTPDTAAITIYDDVSGPSVGIHAWDPDATTEAQPNDPGRWTSASTIVGNPSNDKYDPADATQFRIALTATLQEDLTIYVRIREFKGSDYWDEAHLQGKGAYLTNDAHGQVEGVVNLGSDADPEWAYKITINKDTYHTTTNPIILNIPKKSRGFAYEKDGDNYIMDAEGNTIPVFANTGRGSLSLDGNGCAIRLMEDGGNGTMVPAFERTPEGQLILDANGNSIPAYKRESPGTLTLGEDGRASHSFLGYENEEYFAVIASVKGCESYVNTGANMASVEISSSYSIGPWSNIKIEYVGTNDPTEYQGDLENKPQGADPEGEDAKFKLTLSSGRYGNNHDLYDETGQLTAPTGDTYTDAAGNVKDVYAGDGKLDHDITVTLLISSNSYGMNLAADLGDLQAIKDANPHLTITKWDTASGNLEFIVPKGYEFTNGIPFSLPIANDTGREALYEYYDIRVTATTGTTPVSTPVKMAIKDEYGAPHLSLHHANGDDSVIEGNDKGFYIEVTQEVTSAFTVEFKYEAVTATQGQDYTPSPISLVFNSGMTGAFPADDGETYGKWVSYTSGDQTIYRYYFKVPIPDDKLTEPNETLKINIDRCSDFMFTVNKNPLETTIYDGDPGGPLVYFAKTSETVFEDVQSITYDVILETPAVQPVDVTIEIVLHGCASDDIDFAKLGANLQGGSYVYDAENNRHYIKLTIPQGSVQHSVTLSNNPLVNDHLTESNESFSFVITEVSGGEARIDTDKDKLTVNINDHINGPEISISADKSQIHENPDRTGGTAGEDDAVTFTFKLPDNYTGDGTHTSNPGCALQDIEITFKVEVLEGDLADLFYNANGVALTKDNYDAERISNYYFESIHETTNEDGSITRYAIGEVVIPAGESSITWTAPPLRNDIIDERSPQDKFQVVITDVKGNEAQIGGADKAEVTVVDDDHAPVAVMDKIILLVEAKPTTGGKADINVLGNDSDEDNDPLSTKNETVNAAYGQYVIDKQGNLVYQVDYARGGIDVLAEGETLQEDDFVYTLRDRAHDSDIACNEVLGTVGLDIKATNTFTGDANKSEWIFGSDRGETIKGLGGGDNSAFGDVVHGGKGNDTIYISGHKADVLYGGEDNDYFVFTHKTVDGKNMVEFADLTAKGAPADPNHPGFIIDGGADDDRLAMTGNNVTFYFTGNGWGEKIRNVEGVDIAAQGQEASNNEIIINADAVQSLTATMDDNDPYGVLRIDGATGDRFSFGAESWTAGTPNEEATGYTQYTHSDGTKVLINNALAQVYNGTADNETLTVNDSDGTGNHAVYGGDGDDSITGGGGNDQLYGGAGNDTLDGGSGSQDQLFGEEGDDLLIIRDTTQDTQTTNFKGTSAGDVKQRVTGEDFRLVDGGTGTDTLQIDGGASGAYIDFTQINPQQIKNIEVIDLANRTESGAFNEILLSEAALNALAATSETGRLEITGNAATDRYELCGEEGFGSRGDWTWSETLSTPDWNVYVTAEGKELWVQADLVRVISGSADADAISGGSEEHIVIEGGADNDSIIGGAGHETIYGGEGHDTIRSSGPGATTAYGGDGRDVIYGNADGATTMYGGGDNDALHHAHKNDKLYGDDGNDVLYVKPVDSLTPGTVGVTDFSVLNGGDGIDTVKLHAQASGVTLDLTGVAETNISGVEAFDISGQTGGGANTLRIDSNSLTALSATLSAGQDQVRVTGKAGDVFCLVGDGDWTFQGNTDGWLKYTNAANKELWIHNTLKRVYAGSDADNAFRLDDVNNDDVIDIRDFASADGKGGADNVFMLGENAASGISVDLSKATTGTINNMHRLDVSGTGTGDNHVILSTQTLLASNQNTFIVDGGSDAGDFDTYEVGPGWNFLGVDGAYYKYQAGEKTLLVNKNMGRVLQGDSDPNCIVVHDLNSDGSISHADFYTIDGGNGRDTLQMDTGIDTLNLTGMNTANAGAISGIEVVNLDTGDANAKTIILDGQTLTQMGFTADADSYLVIDGRASDRYILSGDGWSYQNTTPDGYLVYKDTLGKYVRVKAGMGRVYEGTNGNDSIAVEDITGDNFVSVADFVAIDGKAGTDALSLSKDGMTLDLRGLGDQIQNIAAINLNGKKNSTLVLDDAAIDKMGLDTLTVYGGPTDNLQLDGSWTFVKTDVGFSHYTDGNGKTLLVDTAVRLTTKGTTGNDTLYARSASDHIDALSGDDVIYITGTTANSGTGDITGQDFGKITGGDGEDSLRVNTGRNLNFTDLRLGDGQLAGVEVIDLRGSDGANKLTIDADTPGKMGRTGADNPLYVTGDSSDTIELTGDWSYDAHITAENSGYYAYTNNGNVVLVETAVQHVVAGSDSGDTIHVHTAKDDVAAGSGNDTIVLHANSESAASVGWADFARIDGGDNTDAITLGAPGMTLDLTGFDGSAGTIHNVEILDLRGNDANTLKIDASTFTGMGGITSVTVTGDSGGALELHGAWSLTAKTGETATYSNGVQTVVVDSDVSCTIKGGSGNDVFLLHNVDGTGAVTGADIGVIVGGGDGAGVLRLADGSLNLDLSDIAQNQITGVNRIDLAASNGANTITLNADTIARMGLTTLTIDGDDADSFTLDGAGWSYTGTHGGYYTYSDATSNTLKVAMEMNHVIAGSDGPDALATHTEKDAVNAGADNDAVTVFAATGNDTGVITGADFASINGGDGADTIAVGDDNADLDLTTLGGTGKITGVECVDVTGKGVNTVTVDSDTFANMGLVGQTLTVNGDAADTLFLKGSAWRKISPDTYTDETNTVLASGMQAKIVGTGANESFTIEDSDGISGITGADLPAIAGGAGTADTLLISESGTTVDLSGAASVTGIEGIDLNSGGNTLHLGAATFAALGQTALTIEGGATDAVHLPPGWQCSGASGGYATYTDGANTATIADAVNVTLVGGDGNDTFLFTATADADNNDTLSLAELGAIDGGGGANSIAINAYNLSLDLITGHAASNIVNITGVVMQGEFNTVLLNGDALAQLGLGGNVLQISGDDNDTVSLSGPWQYDAINNVYVNANGKVSVSGDASVTATSGDDSSTLHVAGFTELYGGAGNDVFILGNGADNTQFTAASFGVIDGKGGDNSLMLDGANNTLDLRGIEAAQLLHVNAIDIEGSGNNTIILSNAIFAATASSIVTITGGAGDECRLDAAGLVYTEIVTINENNYYKYQNIEDPSHILHVDAALTSKLIYHGGDGGVTLQGGNGDNVIYGGDGADELLGGDGNDEIYGGLGNDTLTGGLGADIFGWRTADLAGGDIDSVTDFDLSEDKLFIETLFGMTENELAQQIQSSTLDVAATNANSIVITTDDNAGGNAHTISLTLHGDGYTNYDAFTPDSAGETAKAEFLLQILTQVG